jgi:hypothetical protein
MTAEKSGCRGGISKIPDPMGSKEAKYSLLLTEVKLLEVLGQVTTT